MTRPRLVTHVSLPHVANSSADATQRALQSASEAMRELAQAGHGEVLVIDLVLGRNKFNHGLGRAPRFVQVCPSVADATFAFALVNDNPVPALQVWLDVVGVEQPACRVWIV